MKTTDIPENIGTTDVCIEFSHQFGQPFQINVQSMVPPVFNITGTIAGRYWQFMSRNQATCAIQNT